MSSEKGFLSKFLYFVTATGFWLVMMGLLIQKEYYGLARVQTPYEILPIQTSSMREGYLAYYLGANRIGFGQTILINNDLYPKKDQQMPESEYTLKHSTYLTFLLFGHESEVFAKGLAGLDDKLNMESFTIRVKNKETFTHISGEVRGEEIVVLIKDGETETDQQTIPIKGPVLHSESLSYLWTPDNLKIGKRGRFQIFNPLALRIEDVRFHVSHKTDIMLQGKETVTLVVFITKGDIKTRIWVTETGEIAQMETVTGMILKKEPGWLIFDEMREMKGALPDLPNFYSVEVEGELIDPEELSYLRINLTTPQDERVIEVRRIDLDSFKDISYPFSSIPEEVKPFLLPSEFVQSDFPEIRQKAEELVAGEKDALTATLRILEWINRNLTPVPTSSIPVASQVFKNLEGDCNEYATLFTALARAANIPTKMIAGLVYKSGRFFYHAWVEVYLDGQWLPLDPSFAQVPTDATHIPLIEGNIQAQVALANIVGNLKISILESKK